MLVLEEMSHRNLVVIGNRNSDEIPIIGSNVYFSPGCMVLGRVKVGNNVKIAPNSVVNSDVPDSCLVAGNPAKIIKFYI